jgi:hypothetical protein
MLNPVNTNQFVVLFSTTCFGIKGHHQVEHNNKRIYSRTPLNWINWDGEPSGYVENLASWIFLFCFVWQFGLAVTISSMYLRLNLLTMSDLKF